VAKKLKTKGVAAAADSEEEAAGKFYDSDGKFHWSGQSSSSDSDSDSDEGIAKEKQSKAKSKKSAEKVK